MKIADKTSDLALKTATKMYTYYPDRCTKYYSMTVICASKLDFLSYFHRSTHDRLTKLNYISIILKTKCASIWIFNVLLYSYLCIKI